MLELIAETSQLAEVVIHVLYATRDGSLIGPVEGRIVEVWETSNRVAWWLTNGQGNVTFYLDTSEHNLFYAKTSAPGAMCEEKQFTAIEGEGPIHVIVRCIKHWRLWLALFTRG